MNLAKLMKQAQQMQAGMAAAREELGQRTVEASVGGGKVTVTATGAGDITALRIDPAVVDPADVEFLEQLILKGVQEAVDKARQLAAAEMQKFTGGMGIPGL
jgi:hypothetical protein